MPFRPNGISRCATPSSASSCRFPLIANTSTRHISSQGTVPPQRFRGKLGTSSGSVAESDSFSLLRLRHPGRKRPAQISGRSQPLPRLLDLFQPTHNRPNWSRNFQRAPTFLDSTRSFDVFTKLYAPNRTQESQQTTPFLSPTTKPQRDSSSLEIKRTEGNKAKLSAPQSITLGTNHLGPRSLCGESLRVREKKKLQCFQSPKKGNNNSFSFSYVSCAPVRPHWVGVAQMPRTLCDPVAPSTIPSWSADPLVPKMTSQRIRFYHMYPDELQFGDAEISLIWVLFCIRRQPSRLLSLAPALSLRFFAW